MPAPLIPSDILLPGNAKYFSFKNSAKIFNSNYDITWSFMYMISNTSGAQHGISTFISPLSVIPTDVIPGHYLCTKPTESTSTVQFLLSSGIISYNPYNILTVAIDTTGYFALSSPLRGGVEANSLSANTLVVRGYNNEVIYYAPLPPAFSIENQLNTVRCRFSNSKETLYIDYRDTSTTNFTLLAEVPTGYKIYNIGNSDILYTGITFCSPLSTSATNVASLILYNLHSEGISNNTSTETITSAPIS